MTLGQFLVLARQDIDKFEAMWMQGNRQDPEHFPDEMPVSDWYEQFVVETGL